MKQNKYYQLTVLTFLCLLLTGLPARAQRPQTSTDEAPVWYYIQVMGDGDRTDRVMTELDNGNVYGRALIDSDNAAGAAAQLWRAEADGSNYRFVNRRSGRYMSVSYDATKQIGVATTSAANDTRFRLTAAAAGNGRYFNIAASSAPEGADASEVYLHQANNGGSRDYIIMMVGTSYAGSENSAFRFVEFEDNSLSHSDEETTRWYRIYSAGTALAGQCLQQNTEAEGGKDGVPFVFAEERDAASEQEWKLIGNDNGTTAIVNRATGNVLLPESRTNGTLNIIQSAVSATSGSGWTLTYIGKGQYVIAGQESDGITRYLNAADESALPETFRPDDNHQDTGFAFRFKLVEEVTTSVDAATLPSGNPPLKIKVENGRISVEGHTRFTVHTISGQPMNPAGRLPTGIYLVSTGNSTVKVHVH